MLGFEPGKVIRHNLKFDDKGRATIPCLVFAPKQATEKTPRVFITCGSHGNEVNGILAMKHVRNRLQVNKLKKIVYLVPVINEVAYLNNERRVKIDAKDLNRNFIETNNPQTPNSFTSNLAKVFVEKIVKDCEFGIDFHDAGDRDVVVLHARAHIAPNGVCKDGCSMDMAKASGLKFILKRAGTKGMLAREVWRYLKKPVLTIEIGGGGIVWSGFVQQAVQATFNILIAYEAYEGEQILPDRQNILLKDRKHIVSPITGISESLVKLGQAVERGDALARVYDPISGVVETVKSDKCGLVFSKRLKVFVKKGDPLISILQLQRCWAHKEEPFDGALEVVFNK